MSNYTLNPELNEEILSRIWNRVRDSPSFWGDIDGARKVSFVTEITRSFATILFDYGFAHFEVGSEPGLAKVHMIFWSPSMWKHFDDMHSAIALVVKKYSLLGLEAIVPMGIRSLRKILERLGFHYTNTISDYYIVRGQLYDADRYLILKEEE